MEVRLPWSRKFGDWGVFTFWWHAAIHEHWSPRSFHCLRKFPEISGLQRGKPNGSRGYLREPVPLFSNVWWAPVSWPSCAMMYMRKWKLLPPTVISTVTHACRRGLILVHSLGTDSFVRHGGQARPCLWIGVATGRCLLLSQQIRKPGES